MSGDTLVGRLKNPDDWDAIAAAIGRHPHVYDLEDSSHLMDVVQIVCTAAAFHFSGKGALMSGHDSAAATQSFTVEVLSVGRRGTKITMPHNWQVIGCDITNDPGGSWIDLVVLQPVSDSTGGES